jgi:hypothetical protein
VHNGVLDVAAADLAQPEACENEHWHKALNQLVVVLFVLYFSELYTANVVHEFARADQKADYDDTGLSQIAQRVTVPGHTPELE